MDSAPLNLAHFHERRADKFLRHHRFDDALKAVEMSLLYLQDAYKNVRIAKSVEVLDTQRWDLERKLRQIQMRKQQYERSKLKDIVPPIKETTSVLTLKPENSVTAQSVAKSIDKTIRDFDAKFGISQDIASLWQVQRRRQLSKENEDPRDQTVTIAGIGNETRLKLGASKQCDKSGPGTSTSSSPKHIAGATQSACVQIAVDCEDLPALAPLELPAFDFNVFTTSAPSLASIAGLAESFQK